MAVGSTAAMAAGPLQPVTATTARNRSRMTMPIPPQVRSTSLILLIGLSLDAFMLGLISLRLTSGSLPGLVRLVTLGTVDVRSCVLVALGYSVTSRATRIEAAVTFKVTARTIAVAQFFMA